MRKSRPSIPRRGDRSSNSSTTSWPKSIATTSTSADAAAGMRLAYIVLGTLSLLIGAMGAVLPLLPTVPFVLLAAFFFARCHPPLEAWLLRHPRFGPHIV